MAGRDGINRRGIDKFTKALNKELQKAARRNLKPLPVDIDSEGQAVAIHNIYGDTIYVNGDRNQVAVSTNGDVSQTSAEQNIDVAALLGAVRDLLASEIDYGAPDIQQEVQANALALDAEARADQPDHGKLQRLASAIGERLRAVSTTATGGFIAQGLAAAFLPT